MPNDDARREDLLVYLKLSIQRRQEKPTRTLEMLEVLERLLPRLDLHECEAILWFLGGEYLVVRDRPEQEKPTYAG